VQPLLLWKISKYYQTLGCICSPRYPARNARAPCCLLWAARLYHEFLHYLIKGTILEKMIGHEVCILIFSTTFV
jgi:hypothetical protein